MGRVRIEIVADDKSAEVLKELQENLGDVEAQGAKTAGGLESFASEMEKLTGTIEHSFSAMTRADLVQITLQQSTDAVAQAQDRYNRVVAEYGASSQEAEAAARQLEKAQDNLDKAQLRAQLSMGLMVTQGAALLARLPAMVAGLQAAGAAGSAAAVGVGVFNIALTAGVAAVTITAGILALNSAIEETEAAATGAATAYRDLDLAARESAILGQMAGVSRETEEARGRLAELAAEMERLAEASLTRSAPAHIQGEYDMLAQTIMQGERRLVEMERELGAMRDEAARQWVTDERTKAEASENLMRTYSILGNEIQDVEEQLKDSDLDLDARDTLTNKLAELRRGFKEVGDEMARMAEKARNEAGAALQGVGVDAERLQASVLASMGAAGGALGDFARRAQQARDAEDALVAAAVKATPALLDQVSVTRRKGESNHELAQRLGLTVEQEKALEEQSRFTTEGIISQEEAQRRLMEQQEKERLKAEREAKENKAQLSTTTFAGVTVHQAFTGPQDLAGTMGPERPDSWFQQYHAADGMDDVVNSPTLILAGERGAERVQIGPPGQRVGGAQDEGAAMPLHVTVNVYGVEDADGARNGARAGIRQGLTGLSIRGRRVATREGF